MLEVVRVAFSGTSQAAHSHFAMVAMSHIVRGAMVCHRLNAMPQSGVYATNAGRILGLLSTVTKNSQSRPVPFQFGKITCVRQGPVERSKIFRPKSYEDIQLLCCSRTRALSTGSEGAALRTNTCVEEKEVYDFKDSKNVIDVLEERGLIDSITGDGIRLHCSNPIQAPAKVYCGFDPTAESLHLGNLLGIIVLAWFQRCGHIPVALMGGATARVGDPSGKSVERPVMSDETIERNLQGIQTILENILMARGDSEKNPGESGFHAPVIVNNYDWWKTFGLLDFLRDVGKYARVGSMMAKESVKRRLNSEDGMSYTEFTYQLLQGYDFLKMFKEDGISVQIGGSDQWGNITAGTELIRKVLQQDGAHGLTWPLLLKSDGTKFGKSEGGAIWLAASMLSPYKFYQYLFGTSDADVIKLLKVLTFLDLEEIQSIETAMRTPGYVPNTAQRRLAEEVTRFVHGEQALADAQKATDALAPGASTTLDVKVLEAIAQDVPSCSISRAEVVGSSLVDVCVKTELLASKAAARRLIKQGGLYLNNEKVTEDSKSLEEIDLVDGKMILLSAGKKNKLVVRLQ
ncbi:tyrosyl-tRNA synthetase [Marchantia polymorpha subsp. ruderalis]|uniref:Tyrosine--tRNA ligase n=2 Tax=Marchantia polymorpha TaxID=3197 RepID=A0AAF6BLX9_MARPO|nr:hypothetical protein MARPO_0163s0012 [Marchantia polymorpha]BBN13013.1 hypothetical protein Mp_6g00080 [Marchantia polymorpha subsp. ruderalis]|eukprot:PTQ28454.1 hypothetical protein MARPO_0163s0012 [Marchantia polymorpha]